MLQPIFRVNPTDTLFPSLLNLFSGERSATGVGSSGPFLFYPPRAITVVAGTIARATVPGGGGIRIECINGTEGGTQTGADVDLTGANTSVLTEIGGTWTLPTDATVSSGKHLHFDTISGTTTLDDNNIVILYEDAADASISYHGFGSRTENLLSGLVAGTNYFITFGVQGDTPAATITESNVQTPWPSTGVFQHVALNYLVGAGTGTVTLVLRINGVDTGITFSLATTGGTSTLLINSALTASVNAGDLVSWRVSQASGVLNFACVAMCGFVRS